MDIHKPHKPETVTKKPGQEDPKILGKEEIEKLDNLNWSDITDDIIRNKEMLREDIAQEVKSLRTNVNKVDLKFLQDVPLKFCAEIGTKKLLISEVLKYDIGSVVELESSVGQPLNLYVNNVLIGLGVIIEKNDKYGVRITEIFNDDERMENLSVKAFNKK